MPDFFADPERLRAMAPHFEAAAEGVHTALQSLVQGLQAEGRCWGGDRPGKEFEKGYPQEGPGSVQEAQDLLKKLADDLSATGNKITGTANTVQAQDQINAAGIQQSSPGAGT
ncbi:MAG: WXG100 family type VII secretion target [Nocardia sp.]|nr:WXG100 family type VII secretion target [Nocardia sp.]